MNKVIRAGAILTAWLAMSAVGAGAAGKRVRPDTSRWDDAWVLATVPVPASLPGEWVAGLAGRVPASPWMPNDGARVLNAGSGNLVPGTINSSWNNASGGNWSTSTDWTPNGSPNNGGGNVYDVTLPTLTSNYTVTQDVTSSIDTLTIDSGATLTQNSGISLTTTGLTDSGTINLGNGGASTLTVNGATTISSGSSINLNSASTLNLNGAVNNSGTFATGFSSGNNSVTVSGAFTNNSGATLELEGSGDVMSVASLSNSGTVDIDSGATLNLTSQPNGITDVPAGSQITIDGSLKAGTANGLAKLGSIEGTLNLNNNQTNAVTPGSGTLTIASGGSLNLSDPSSSTTTLSITGAVSNSGQVTTGFSGGTNTITVSGAFTNNAGATLDLEGSNDTVNVASLSNSGTVDIGSGDTVNLTNQPSGITSIVQGSIFTIDGNLKAGTANGLAQLTTVAGTLNLNNGQTNAVTPSGGTLTINSGASVNLSDPAASTTTLAITGAVNNSGQVTTGFSGGTNTITVSGAFTNNAGAALDLEGSNDTVSVASLSNSGTVSIGTGDTLNLTNQPNGITDIPQGSTLVIDGSLKAGSANGLAQLASVEGILDLNNGQTNAVTPGGGTLTISSTGSVNLSDPIASTTTLSITGNVTNSGEVTTGFTGGTNTVNVSGAFTNNALADLDIESSTDVVSVATLSNSGAIVVDPGASLKLTNQPNGITDIVAGSSISLYGNFTAGSASALSKLSTVAGVLDLQNGQTTSVTPTGTFTVASTGQVNLSPDAATTTTLAITGNVSNSGEITTGGLGGTNTITVSGSFTNGTGAVLDIGNGASTNDLVKVGTLTNSSTINVGTGSGETGATLELASAGTSSNSGTINLGSTDDNQNTVGTIEIAGSAVTLSGTGKIVMANLSGNVITAAAATDVLTSANTIEGSGNIGNGNMGFVNTGTVEANQSTALIIDPSSKGFNNTGTLNVSAGDEMEITGPANSFLNYSSSTDTLTGGTYLVSGTLQFGATGNTITTDDAKITLTGSAAKIVTPSGGDIIAPLATIGTGGLFDIAGGANFTTEGNFTNNGTLTVGSATKFVVKSGSSLTNFSGTTLTGGTYDVTGTLQFGPSGTSLVTNAASITLTGANAKIVSSTGTSILTDFATNNAGALFDVTGGYSFTTVGNFTNNGTLTVGSSTSKFVVNGDLTNFNSTTNTLTNGTYSVSGTLQFDNANIVTNDANLTLSGASYKILNQTSGNGIASFATNNGSLTLASDAGLTTPGSVTNSGTVKVEKGSDLTVEGNGSYTQTAGSTTVDGTLTTGSTDVIQVNAGSVFGNGGTLNGNVSMSGTLYTSDTTTTAGKETVSGTYTQNSGGALDINIGGTTAGTNFSQLTVDDAASLNGTLNLALINNFIPTTSDTFEILTASSVGGTFSTVNGLEFNNDMDHFVVVYNTNNVTLDVASGPGAWGGSGSGLLASNSQTAQVPGRSPSVPEPGSLLLLGSGLAGMAGYLRRRKK